MTMEAQPFRRAVPKAVAVLPHVRDMAVDRIPVVPCVSQSESAIDLATWPAIAPPGVSMSGRASVRLDSRGDSCNGTAVGSGPRLCFLAKGGPLQTEHCGEHRSPLTDDEVDTVVTAVVGLALQVVMVVQLVDVTVLLTVLSPEIDNEREIVSVHFGATELPEQELELLELLLLDLLLEPLLDLLELPELWLLLVWLWL